MEVRNRKKQGLKIGILIVSIAVLVGIILYFLEKREE
jgi:hypothetical protein